MKKFLLIATLLFSSSIFAANVSWYDMELQGRYTLKQDIVFDNGITFKAGDQFDMLDFIAGGTPVAYFQMHYTGCKLADQTAELILVEVANTPKKTVIGAQLDEGCNLELYVEVRDFFVDSIFTE